MGNVVPKLRFFYPNTYLKKRKSAMRKYINISFQHKKIYTWMAVLIKPVFSECNNIWHVQLRHRDNAKSLSIKTVKTARRVKQFIEISQSSFINSRLIFSALNHFCLTVDQLHLFNKSQMIYEYDLQENVRCCVLALNRKCN